MNRFLRCLPLIASVSAIPAMASMTLTSKDIAPDAPIATAQIYPRCGGDNISPELTWGGAPAGTKNFALTMIDVSVKPSDWSHWIVVGLTAEVTSLARGAKTLPSGATAVASNFGNAMYDGPCPPTGSGVHEYQLTIWALPTATLSIAPNMKATDLRASLDKIALDHATLTGFVKR